MSSFALFHVFLLLIFTHCRVWYNTKVNVFCHFFNCLFYSADMVYFGSQCLNLLNIVKSIIYLSHTIAAVIPAKDCEPWGRH